MSNLTTHCILSVMLAAGLCFFIARIAIQLKNPSLSASERTKIHGHLVVASIAAVVGIGSLIYGGVLVNRTHHSVSPRQAPTPLPHVKDTSQIVPPSSPKGAEGESPRK